MIDWNIQSRSHVCQACQRHFNEGEAFHTLLFDSKQLYERRDLCAGCWEAKALPEVAGSHQISQWMSVYTPPPPAPPEPIGRDTAESLLRKLVEQNDPKHEGARFILAVMLERKRLLKVKAQLRDGGRRVFVYEHPKSGDLIQIVDPDLQLDQLEEVQRDVAHLLEHGLSGGLAEPPAGETEAVVLSPAIEETSAEPGRDSASSDVSAQ